MLHPQRYCPTSLIKRSPSKVIDLHILKQIARVKISSYMRIEYSHLQKLIFHNIHKQAFSFIGIDFFVYIKSFHGKSRAVAVLVMYLMRKEGKGFDGVYGQVKGKYKVAKVNSWFVEQLRKYEKTLDLQKGNKNQSGLMKMKQNFENSSNIHDLLDLTSHPTTQPTSTIPYDPSPQKKQQYHLIQIQVDDDNQNSVQNAQLI